MLWRLMPCDSRFRDKTVAQGADAGDIDLDHVARLDVGRCAVGSHPDHVARPQREIFRQFDDERLDAEDHVVGVEAAGFLAVDPDGGLHPVEIDVGFDPRSHRLEGVGVLGAPQPAVGLLPGAFADIVADGVAEHAGHRVGFGQMFCLLADHDHQFALIVNLLGGIGRDHDILVMRDQRVLRAVTDLGTVWNIGTVPALSAASLRCLR